MQINAVSVGIALTGIVIGTIGLPVAFAANPNTQLVLVTNGATSPVPVSGSVAVNNLPATQPVSGTVNVGNLPATQTIDGTVSITGVPTVAVQALQLFHVSLQLTLASGYAGTINFPAGQRLIVQSMSVSPANAAVNNCGPVLFYDTSNLFNLALDNANLCSKVMSGEALFWSDESVIHVVGPGFSSPGSPLFTVTVSGYLQPVQ